MYCQNCYCRLEHSTLRCLYCDCGFNPSDPATFLARPFPRGRRILLHLVVCAVLSCGVAFVVAFFQAAAMSGH